MKRTMQVFDVEGGYVVSQATLNPRDLIKAFLDFIEDLSEYAELRIQVPQEAWDDDDSGWWSTHLPYGILEEVEDVIHEYTPEGLYFGSHDGDGSLIGFWKIEEEDDDDEV